MKKEYILDGLCCANCAAKIEKEVGDLSEVSEASINLMNNKLSLTMSELAPENLTHRIEKIVASHEPSVKVIDLSEPENEKEKGKEHGEEENTKGYLIRVGITVVITVLFSILPVSTMVKLIFFGIAYLLSGYEVLLNAARNIKKGQVFDENFLMGIASLGAFIIGEQVEAIAVLVFYSIGEMLQDLAVHNSRKNIAGLMDIRPDYANKIVGDKIHTISPEQVNIGDIILVKPGEKIPLDGIVLKGSSFVDTRALTGESVPREVVVSDSVLSGTINVNGVLEIEVTKAFAESTVSKILELVQNAGSKKAESEKFITKFARYYTPFIVFSAVAVAILPPLFGFGSFTDWLYRALSFLIISCPCALVISIPLSFFGGIGGGAKQGVLIKGGNYLDALNHVNTVVFDKTGTLTKGVFEVVKVCEAKGIEPSELIYLAAIAEKHSNHPIAKSIISFYNKEEQKKELEAAEITEIPGNGVVAVLGSDTIYAGNEKLMNKFNIPVQQVNASGSIVHIGKNNAYLGHLIIADEIKPGVKETMLALKQLGVKHTVMLTGDHAQAAKEVAELTGVEEYKAELLPQDKFAWFEEYKASMQGKGKVIFVGDGINDAPVLAGADIGIAMGGIGSDAAIEAADIVIMNDEVGKVVTAIKIAHKTKQIVKQNIIFALGTKLVIMILAFMGITSIWFAIFADVGVALLALLNAMRAMKVK